jgi:hypothetical protein
MRVLDVLEIGTNNIHFEIPFIVNSDKLYTNVTNNEKIFPYPIISNGTRAMSRERMMAPKMTRYQPK